MDGVRADRYHVAGFQAAAGFVHQPAVLGEIEVVVLPSLVYSDDCLGLMVVRRYVDLRIEAAVPDRYGIVLEQDLQRDRL